MFNYICINLNDMEKKSAIESTKDIAKQMQVIGAKIRTIRKQQEPNYQNWALKHGVNKVSLARLEHGENVTLKLLLTVLSKLGVTLKELNDI